MNELAIGLTMMVASVALAQDMPGAIDAAVTQEKRPDHDLTVGVTNQIRREMLVRNGGLWEYELDHVIDRPKDALEVKRSRMVCTGEIGPCS
jgi:hypothetical protein